MSRNLTLVVWLLVSSSVWAIDPKHGEQIKLDLGTTSNQVVAQHLANAVAGDRVTVVPNSATITPQPRERYSTGQIYNFLLASGTFTNGNAAGGVSGGIGIDSGIMLSTGRVSNANSPLEDPQPNNSVTNGVEGSNNAQPEHSPEEVVPLHKTASVVWLPYGAGPFGEGDPEKGDADLAADAGITWFDSRDGVALEFQITTNQRGHLEIEFVFASDEFPEWLSMGLGDYDDAFGVFISGNGVPKQNFTKVILNGQTRVINLDTLFSCGTKFFKVNNTDTLNSPNFPPSTPRFNHEYDMFTVPTKRDTSAIFATNQVLQPGT